MIIDLEPHTFAPKSDDTQHWTQCWCEEATRKIAHESDGGTVTKKATCTATGTKTYKCKHCGEVLNTETLTIKSLKAKTTYYVRIRAYKTVDGEKIYSGWSSYRYKKTK